MGGYNVWCKWHPLRTVMLGRCYPSEFFRNVRNDRIRSALQRITDETQEDLEGFERVLRDFGCTVLRPDLGDELDIMDWVDDRGRVSGMQGVPRSPLQPRDGHLVMGNRMVSINLNHEGIERELLRYNGRDFDVVPTRGREDVLVAPSITLVGRDLYVDQQFDGMVPEQEEVLTRHHPFRINRLHIGGHNDGCFHTIGEGAILSLWEIQRYEHTFPGWDVCFLENQSWDRVQGFLKMKERVKGKWWIPEEEDNDELTQFVETWLGDWVGYVEETVFDVNVLMLDEKHVCVSNHNDTAFEFFRKHGIEPIVVPWRHRFFWDGGLHCITLDLYRQGEMVDYFPGRSGPVTDDGFEMNLQDTTSSTSAADQLR